MTAFYNEIDPYAAAWLRQLIAAGHIAPGVVDTRDIRDLTPDDLKPFTQLHFFAGIGGWSCALRLAGWPDDRPVWTGSCPCQPFSASGKGQAFDDERHLWPVWFKLIAACRPATVFGEQVASKAALDWYDLVSNDLEDAGYALGAADLCAAGLGAPHIRQRLCFGAEPRDLAHTGRASGPERVSNAGATPETHGGEASDRSTGSGALGRMGDPTGRRRGQTRSSRPEPAQRIATASPDDWLAHTDRPRPQGREGEPGADQRLARAQGLADADPWQDLDWLWCREERWRPSQPGLCPLADGVPGRVGRLRAYGNAIVPQVAATFIEAFEASRHDQ
ncbi:DNA cytosine methyltransferase [Ruegeria aquimaris]|uniref:DNA cytosine methyltransferase n=1 Tax=Ruegeria aquimaris TaxID=2984333 RepID=A0ABT3ARG8_9RHOB|nr:DNA cytosine methyltransferase [Ruegeria sp. XHP0148]MCV2891274.1 DNA cytosine methyltransferase [Ruegeria sp. XHP0148]